MIAQPFSIAEDRRRHQRVKISLLGRYMLETRREYPCQAVNMSPGGVALVAPVVGNPGERVVCYLDHVGRIEGQIVRHLPNGFAMTIAATARKREKFAAQLTWLANRHVLNLPEDRRHERILPKNPRSTLTLTNGAVYPCRVIDMSLSGAAVATDLKIELGSAVMLGRMQSHVIRHFEGGVGIQFRHEQLPSVLEAEFGGL